MNHIVWETLDTEEATYLWNIPKDVKMLKNYLLKIEKTIQEIIQIGKTNYLKDSHDSFHRINHDYQNNEEGFYNWKTELESILI